MNRNRKEGERGVRWVRHVLISSRNMCGGSARHQGEIMRQHKRSEKAVRVCVCTF